MSVTKLSLSSEEVFDKGKNISTEPMAGTNLLFLMNSDEEVKN
jgi:hypothetical protein